MSDQPTKTITEMLRDYNALVLEANGLNRGLDRRERKCFKDRADAERSLAAIQSSIRAARAASKVTDEPVASDQSPGRQRLLNSGRAEEIRQQVLVDQEKAAAGAAHEASSAVSAPSEEGLPTQQTEKVSEIMTKLKEKKAKAPKAAKAEGTGRRGRAPAYAGSMKITIEAEGNPKRKDTRGHEVFAMYKSGMLVSTFVEKVGDQGEAMANLRWDVAKGYIKVG
jgi:hypothetical protein